MTSGRHRLNRGGHRQLNAAIYRTVIVRMRHHEPTKAYVARRTEEGKSKRDIIRCLKRYVIREDGPKRPEPREPHKMCGRGSASVLIPGACLPRRLEAL